MRWNVDAYDLRRLSPQCRSKWAGLAVALVLTSQTAHAEEPVFSSRKTETASQADALQGTLLKVKKTGTVRLGYREASIPFSYLDKGAVPVGYSIDLCQAIVEEIGRTVDRTDVRVEYVKVNADERIPALKDGRIDLECGSTTANAERRAEIDFSPMTFVTGTKVLVPRQTRWKDFRTLTDKTIGVSKGTTNEKAIDDLNRRFGLKVKIVTFADHEAGFAALTSGKIDGYASDEVLLDGLITKHNALDKFKIAGELLSYEPYGIAFRKDDPQIRETAYRAFKNLVVNRDFPLIYDKWFLAALSNGQQLKIPMSAQLEEALEALQPGAEPN